MPQPAIKTKVRHTAVNPQKKNPQRRTGVGLLSDNAVDVYSIPLDVNLNVTLLRSC